MNNIKDLIKVSKDGSIKKVRRFMVELPLDIDNLLETIIVPFYRTTSASHAVRLLIQDAAKSIKDHGDRVSLDRRELGTSSIENNVENVGNIEKVME